MKLAIISLLLVTSAAWCQAQDNKTSKQQKKPDFSGTWELDQSLSANTDFSAKITWTITHSEPEIRILQKTKLKGEEKTKQFDYYSDGSGEANTLQRQFQNFFEGIQVRDSYPLKTVQSKTKWDGNKLKTRYTVLVDAPDGKLATIKVEEVLEISAGGKMLIQTTTFSSNNENMSFSPRKVKKVFQKVS